MENNLREMVGLILWWTEGTKRRKDKRWPNIWLHPIEITNTDPRIIKLFLDFLRHDITVEESRLKLQLQIHEGDDQQKLELFWSKMTGIPKSRFQKTIVRPTGNKIGKSQGTCKIRYSSKKIYEILDSKLKILLEKI